MLYNSIYFFSKERPAPTSFVSQPVQTQVSSAPKPTTSTTGFRTNFQTGVSDQQSTRSRTNQRSRTRARARNQEQSTSQVRHLFFSFQTNT